MKRPVKVAAKEWNDLFRGLQIEVGDTWNSFLRPFQQNANQPISATELEENRPKTFGNTSVRICVSSVNRLIEKIKIFPYRLGVCTYSRVGRYSVEGRPGSYCFLQRTSSKKIRKEKFDEPA